MGLVQPEDRLLHCVRHGEGRPVVFLDGAFVTHTDWPATLIDPIAAKAQAILVDRPGHGQSARQRYRGDARDQARQIEAGLALDAPVVLVAHSFGALAALAFAEQFPEQVAATVLLAPVCFPEWRAEQIFLGLRALPLTGPALSALGNATIDPAYLPWIQDQMFAPQKPPDGWRARYPTSDILTAEHFIREGEDSWATSPLSFGAYRAALPSHPLTVIQGDADRIIVNGWHAQLMHWFAPDSRLVWLRNVGHMVHQIEPARVVAEIANLLDETR
jgi:pimeloyl-ACP methyl ester carboxylesterase